MLNNNPDILDKPREEYQAIIDYMGNGILTSGGDRWKQKRKMYNPVFHVKMLKDMSHIFNRNSLILIKELDLVLDKPSIDFYNNAKRCAFANIQDAVFGMKLNVPTDYVLEITDKFSEIATYRILRPWFHNSLVMYLWPPFWKFLGELKDLNKRIRNELENKQKFLSQRSQDPNVLDTDHAGSQKVMVDTLFEQHSKDSSFTLQDVRDDAVTFLAAGYDTVASALMWCIFMLGLHPDVQDQIYEEISTLQNKDVTYEDTLQLEYLDCVIKEIMRLYPPVPVYSRNAGKDIPCGKYIIPKGTLVLFCPYLLHRNPTIYPDPEKFDPERFRGESSEKRSWVYTPFAEGIRNCIGKKFAMLQLKTVLVHILRNFKVTSLDKREEVIMCWSIKSNPAKPLKTKFERRKQEDVITS